MASEIYHVLSRGVDKRIIFQVRKDYLRFVHNLIDMNDSNWVSNSGARFAAKTLPGDIDIASRYGKQYEESKKPLVEIYTFCLMRNHYHLMLAPLIEGGVSKFMKKLNMAYAKYFNIKYERKGTLFEGRYKSILLSKESHFIHLPYYIHFNPLDIKFPEWRERKLKSQKDAVHFLESYPWSSHLDYLGKENFPGVTKREFLWEFFGGKDGYRNKLYSWLKDIEQSPANGLYLE